MNANHGATRPAVTAALALLAALAACDPAQPAASGPATNQLVAAPVTVASAATPARPFWGMCAITVTTRVHEGEDEGGCSGGGEDEGGGEDGGMPPIGRHYDIAGTCELTHLGHAAVSGRLNIPGPFGAGGEGEDDGHGGMSIMVRGRLAFVAANGDTLVGRYVPVAALFTPQDGDGGTLAFTAWQELNQACEGGGGEEGGGCGGGGGGMGGGEEGGCTQPVSSGRFASAAGQDTLVGSLRIYRSSGAGTGTIELRGGVITF